MKKHELPSDLQVILINAVMDITEEQQQDVMFEHGCQYMEQQTTCKRYYELMSGSKKVWSWWIRQWHMRTSILIYELQLDEYNDIPPEEEKQRLRRHYYDIHNVKNINIRPSRVLLEESWKEMMQKPNKQPSKIII